MALKAHLDPAAPGSSQRKQPRRALQLETSGVLPGGLEANVTIHNISAAGLLLETDLPLGEGEKLAIELPEIGRVDAEIVWVSGNLYGCAFAVALGEGVLAATQLRADVAQVPGARPTADADASPFERTPIEPFGSKLNRLRRERGMTLAQVADALGVSKPTVWAWEKGKARPVPDRMEAIAQVMGVTPDELGEATPTGEMAAVIEECRIRIATVCGTAPQKIRIMIEV
ncbi:MAG: helix-turn-helix domain-containing protein [Erythrobacter sp.]|nr:helix-turn-helix domain-containing protein [Erythrobacter sp.]